MPFPRALTVYNISPNGLPLAILYIAYACFSLPSRADTLGVCTDAAGKLLSSLADEEPARYSAATCALAPPATVCEIRGAPGACSSIPECLNINTRVDDSCTPDSEANACCSTFWALQCAECDIFPLACFQFCYEVPVFPGDPPAAPGNETTLPPSAAPDPPEAEDPDSGAETAAPLTAAADTAEPGGAVLTPTGMPRQIVVESISGAATVPGTPAVAFMAAVAAVLLAAGR